MLLPLGGRRWIGGHRSGSDDVPVRAAPGSLPAATPRPVWRPVAAEAITSAIDFSFAGDTLLILDALNRRVVLLRLEGDVWRPLGTIGRRGGGPGEFLRPRSLALLGDSAFAVLEDDGRLQLFGRDGSHHRTETPSLPCPMFAPTLAFAASGRRFAAGNCAGPGAARDTVFTVLFAGPDPAAAATPTVRTAAVLSAGADAAAGTTTDDALAWSELERVPRIALDLSWGSTFATLHPLNRHGDVLYFATGVGGCLTRLPMSSRTPPSPTPPADRCGLVAELFHAEPPPALVANQREARRRGDRKLERALAWPEVLPAFLGIVPAGDSLLLVRPVSADSLAIVPARRPFSATDVRLVAPVGSFVRCTDGACLWYDADRDAIAVVSFDAEGGAIQRGAIGGGAPPPSAKPQIVRPTNVTPQNVTPQNVTPQNVTPQNVRPR